MVSCIIRLWSACSSRIQAEHGYNNYWRTETRLLLCWVQHDYLQFERSLGPVVSDQEEEICGLIWSEDQTLAETSIPAPGAAILPLVLASDTTRVLVSSDPSSDSRSSNNLDFSALDSRYLEFTLLAILSLSLRDVASLWTLIGTIPRACRTGAPRGFLLSSIN